MSARKLAEMEKRLASMERKISRLQTTVRTALEGLSTTRVNKLSVEQRREVARSARIRRAATHHGMSLKRWLELHGEREHYIPAGKDPRKPTIGDGERGRQKACSPTDGQKAPKKNPRDGQRTAKKTTKKTVSGRGKATLSSSRVSGRGTAKKTTKKVAKKRTAKKTTKKKAAKKAVSGRGTAKKTTKKRAAKKATKRTAKR